MLFLGSKAAGLRVSSQLIRLLPPGTLSAIICPDDTADERSVLADFRKLAREAGIPLAIAGSRTETIEILARYSAEVAVVHGWYRVLPVAEVPSTRFFGFHNSPLPKYRGNAPLVWQIIRGESQIGVTFFEMVPGIDEGPMYDQILAPFGVEDTIAEALKKADDIVDSMLARFVADWVDGQIQVRGQPKVEPSYCGLRMPEDGLIDWRASASQIHDFVRAQSRPYPGAFARLPDGRRLTVWKSAPEPRKFIGVPGAVCEFSSSGAIVAAGEGALRIIEVQVEGGSAIRAAEVLNSLKIRLL